VGLDENLPSGTEVVILEAFDRDTDPFNAFVFQFRSDGGPGMDAFSIDNMTGRVTTSKVLDREEQEVNVQRHLLLTILRIISVYKTDTLRYIACYRWQDV